MNADDFGLSRGVNDGIIRAHEHGVVTSTSLMVRCAAAADAAASAREISSLGVGLHIDIGEWFYRDGEWIPSYEVVPEKDAEAVGREVLRQLRRFRDLVGRDPTHLDSHQHVHAREPARTVLTRIAADLGLPLRGFTAGVRWVGAFYGQSFDRTPLPNAIGPGALVDLVRALPEGIPELSCHPGEIEDLDSVYREERARELETLCDPAVRAAIEEAGISLVTYGDPVVKRSLSPARS